MRLRLDAINPFIRPNRAAAGTTSPSLAPLALLVLAVVAFRMFFASSAEVSLGTTVGIYTVLALGLSVVASFGGQLSLAQGAFGAIAGYTFAILTVRYRWPSPAAITLGLVLTTAVAWALGHFLQRLRAFYMAMGTLAFAEIVTVLITSQTSLTGGFSGIPGVPLWRIGDVDISSLRNLYWVVWAVAALSMLAALLVLRSRAGRELNALKTDPLAASLLGHDPAYWKRGAFALSGVYGGVGGVLLAVSTTAVTPDLYSNDLGILLFVMLVVGGWYSLWGAPLGALVVTGLPIWLQAYQGYADLIYTLLVLLVLVVLPRGVAGLAADVVQAARQLLPARSNAWQPSSAGAVEAEPEPMAGTTR